MLSRPANTIPPHKMLLVRLKWREERLDVLSPKEVNLHPRDTQARGIPKKSGANHHDTFRIHIKSCAIVLTDQARRNDGRKAGRVVSTQGPGASQPFHTVSSGSLYTIISVRLIQSKYCVSQHPANDVSTIREADWRIGGGMASCNVY